MIFWLLFVILIEFSWLVSSSNDEPFLSNWTLDTNVLPSTMARAFAVYDEARDTIFGIGGTDCTNCAYAYNLTNNSISGFSIDATDHDTTFFNGDVCSSTLIDENTMLAMDHTGQIWEYNVETRSISIRFGVNDKTYSIFFCLILLLTNHYSKTKKN